MRTATSGISTACVLCKSCANLVRSREAGERRRFPRVCAAGLVLGPELFDCDSYVPQGIHRAKGLAAGPRGRHA